MKLNQWFNSLVQYKLLSVILTFLKDHVRNEFCDVLQSYIFMMQIEA